MPKIKGRVLAKNKKLTLERNQAAEIKQCYLEIRRLKAAINKNNKLLLSQLSELGRKMSK